MTDSVAFTTRRIGSTTIVALLLLVVAAPAITETVPAGVLAIGTAVAADEPADTSWTIELGGDVAAAPVVDGGTVYVANGSTVTALDPSDGDVHWTHDLDGRITASPVLDTGRVLAADEYGTIVALDAATGDPMWTYEADGAIEGPIAIDSEVAYAADGDGTVHALALDDGRAVWTHDAPRPVTTAGVVVADERVLVADADGVVHAFATDTRERLWTRSVDGNVTSTPAVHNDTVVVADTDGTVAAFTIADGEPRWTATTGLVLEPLAADERHIYVGTRDGTVNALDAETGAQNWSTTVPTDEFMGAAPAVVGDEVLVGTDDGVALGLDGRDGSERWTLEVDGGLVTTPAVGESVFVGDETGRLYARSPGAVALSIDSIERDEDTLRVEFSLENHGDEAVEREVSLDVGDDGADVVRSITADASEAVEATFEHEPIPAEDEPVIVGAGAQRVESTVPSDDDSEGSDDSDDDGGGTHGLTAPSGGGSTSDDGGSGGDAGGSVSDDSTDDDHSEDAHEDPEETGSGGNDRRIPSGSSSGGFGSGSQLDHSQFLPLPSEVEYLHYDELDSDTDDESRATVFIGEDDGLVGQEPLPGFGIAVALLGLAVTILLTRGVTR